MFEFDANGVRSIDAHVSGEGDGPSLLSVGKEGEQQIAGTGARVESRIIQLANGKYRVPDILNTTRKVLGEVKLYVRPGNGTKISQNLLDEIANSKGMIKLYRVLT